MSSGIETIKTKCYEEKAHVIITMLMRLLKSGGSSQASEAWSATR